MTDHSFSFLTLRQLQSAHVARQEDWCPDQKPDLSFRGNELGGECGEAQNVIKKLERERHGWRGSRDTVEHLGEELADVIHCAVLCAITAGIDIEQAVVAKFNSTSEKNDLPHKIGTPAPESQMEGKEPPLDWSNFEGPKLNIEWKPDDQDLIYTAINFRDDEYGDKDDDAGQQIVERLLAAWKSTAISEQITFENAVRLLKERDELRAGIKRLSDEEELCDETTGDDPFSIVRLAAKLAAAEEARAEQWRLRRDAEASRDAMRAAADSLLQDRKALIEAIQPLLGCADFARENDLSGHETLIVTANEAREAATVVERINAEEEDQS
nr:MazG nucleotide pyrophosphohydrolase domain superfamily protein [Rhizobium sp. Q54]